VNAMSDEFKKGDWIFMSFLDEKEIQRSGFFEIREFTDNHIIIKTNHGNIILIPMNRILKIKKEKREEE